MSATAQALPIAIRSVDPDCSAGWWARAWALFLRAPVAWLAWGVALMLAMALLAQVPLAGPLLAGALSPHLLGGWMLAARKLQAGGSLGARDAFAGFHGAHARPLLGLGAVLAACAVVLPLAAHVFGADAVMGAVAVDAGPSGDAARAAMGTGMLALLLLLVVSLVASAALWFAPALVVLHHASAGQALRASLRAVLDNGLTFLLYTVIQLLLAALASLLPWQAGWLVLLPVMLLTVYVSYDEVFGR